MNQWSPEFDQEIILKRPKFLENKDLWMYGSCLYIYIGAILMTIRLFSQLLLALGIIGKALTFSESVFAALYPDVITNTESTFLMILVLITFGKLFSTASKTIKS